MKKLILFLFTFFAFQLEAQCSISIGVVPIPGKIEVIENFASGEFIDVVEKSLKRKSIKVEYVHQNFARLLALTKKGEIDALMPLIESDKRKEFVHYTGIQLGTVQMSFWANKEFLTREVPKKPIVATVRALAKKASNKEFMELVEMPDMTQALKLVQKGRVDYALVVDQVALKFADEKLVKFKQVSELPVYLGLAKNSENFFNLQKCLVSSES